MATFGASKFLADDQLHCAGCSGVGEADLKAPANIERLIDPGERLTPAGHAQEIFKLFDLDAKSISRLQRKDPGVSVIKNASGGWVSTEAGKKISSGDFIMDVQEYSGDEIKNSFTAYRTLERAAVAFAARIINEPHGSVTYANDKSKASHLMFVSEKLFACVLSGTVHGEDLNILLYESRIRPKVAS